jgi:hypothetical protein
LKATQNPEDLTWIAKVKLNHDFANMTWVYVCINANEANSLEDSKPASP